MSSNWSVSPWPATLACSSLAVAVGVFSGFAGPARSIVALWFLAVCPGMALVGLLDIDEPLVQAVLAVSISLALDALISIIGLYVGGVGSEDVLVVLIAITLAGAAAQAAPPRSRRTKLIRRRLLTSVVRRQASTSVSGPSGAITASQIGAAATSPVASLESRRDTVEARKAAAPAGAQAGTTADRSILGDAADATTIAAITSIVRELLSCANVGAFLQGFMLFSPDYYRRFRAEIGLTDAEFRAEFGTIRPKPQEEWSEIAAVRDARTLPDGRVTAAISYTNAAWTIPQPEESYTFVRLLDADYWLIDDITPLVGDDPGSTAAYQKDHSIAAMSTAADLVIIDPESKSTK